MDYLNRKRNNAYEDKPSSSYTNGRYETPNYNQTDYRRRRPNFSPQRRPEPVNLQGELTSKLESSFSPDKPEYKRKNFDFMIVLTTNFYFYIERNYNRLKGEVSI